ncbi:MAG: hypothetical protein HC926_04150 [Synechococcaceae cyanobacterium SM2_3_60]|nr:hypothetical protein [Synechococcaceae cyanobacterium SM2_3_60]
MATWDHNRICETFRYTTEAVFDSDSGVSGQITGEHTRATFEGTTQREGNAVTHQRTVETEQGGQYQVNSDIELSGTGSFSGSRTHQTDQGWQRTLEFSGSRQP